MTDYRFTPGAEDDPFEIWCYIARDSGGGRRFFLAPEPRSGSPRRQVTALSVHFWTVRPSPNCSRFTAPKLSLWKLFASCTSCDLERLL
jgi:hypothetical protein